jgi:hypothetical protein
MRKRDVALLPGPCHTMRLRGMFNGELTAGSTTSSLCRYMRVAGSGAMASRHL